MCQKYPQLRVLVLLLACMSRSHQANAQSIGGSILGIVKDVTGPVPQAEVRITNISTGQSRFWLTDDQGRYELREVPPGLYELKVSKDGYSTFSTPPSEGLHLRLAQVANVGDITLKVAPVGETKIDVKSADIAMTDLDSATLGTAFNENQIHALPISARDVNNLGLLGPGVVNVSSFNVANTLVAFAVNGSRGRDNNFIIDSVDNNDPLFGGAATQFTDNEVFDEFHILTGQYQAEYGRNSGGIVNVITRQGGSDFHGSVFWFGQNDAFNAMTKVEKQSGLTKPARFYENQVGATANGPIKRDSAWFFLSYQWDRARNDLSSQYPVIVTLPTAQGLAMLKTFNGMNPSPTLTALLADPLVETLPTLRASCGSVLPKSSIIPMDIYQFGFLFQSIPVSSSNPCTTSLPNQGVSINGISIPFGTYLVPKANVTDLRDHEAFTRIDEKVSQRDGLFFRYLFDDFLTPLAPSSSPAEIGFSDSGVLPEWRNFLADRTQNFGSAWTHASNRALNELRLSYSRSSSTIGPLGMNPEGGETPAISSGIDSFAPSPFYLSAAGSEFTLGTDSKPAQFNNNVYQLQENYSFAHGIHDVKLGVNFNETRSGLNQIPGNLGQDFYDGFQSFFDNEVQSASLRFGNVDGKGGALLPLREIDQFYFIQDAVHLLSNFTLNLGLRYENYSPSFNAVVDRSESTSMSPPRLDRVFTNFAPRLGFAWEIGQHTVLRGGLGVFYNPTFLDIALLAWQSSPISPFVQGGLFFVPQPNPYPNPPLVSADTTLPNTLGQDCSGNFLSPFSAQPTSLDCATQNTVPKNLRNPFEYSASLGAQRQISKDLLFEASYFGSRGTRLFQRLDINPVGPVSIACPFNDIEFCPGPSITRTRLQPNRGIITEITNGGFSTYHSLQLSATKRFRGGSFWDCLALSSAYTWSHMIDNTSDPFGSGVLQRLLPPASTGVLNIGAPLPGNTASQPDEPQEDPTPFAQNPANTRAGEKGNSSFDRRHRLAVSFVVALPYPPKEARVLFANWEIAGVFTAQSGEPFSPLNGGGGCSSNVEVGGEFAPGLLGNQRPNIGNPHAPENTVALLNNSLCLNPNSTDPAIQSAISFNQLVFGAGPYITPSFEPVDPSTVRFVQAPIDVGFGNAGRNILTGPPSANLDLAMSKTIPLSERFRVQLRAEVYDLFNRRNPGPFAGNPFIAAAQPVSSTVFNDTPGAIPNPRATQARVSGFTPENSIDAGIVNLPFIGPQITGDAFLSQKYLTTSSRRVQFSVRLSF